jgi:predicted AAA+ superfamily ATPase
LGIRDREQLFLNPLRGNIFESFIVSELLNHRLNAGLPADLYSWADNSKTEVDALIEDGARIAAIEIKSGQTILPEFFNGLKNWIKYSGSPAKDCYLVYAGDIQVTQQDMHIISWDRTIDFFQFSV